MPSPTSIQTPMSAPPGFQSSQAPPSPRSRNSVSPRSLSSPRIAAGQAPPRQVFAPKSAAYAESNVTRGKLFDKTMSVYIPPFDRFFVDNDLKAFVRGVYTNDEVHPMRH